MKQRLLISVLCVSLASMAPVPLSACAMLMAAPADCAPAVEKPVPTASHCELATTSKTTGQVSLRAGATELPCCELTAAPAPDASIALGKIHVTPAAASVGLGVQAFAAHVIERAVSKTEFEQYASPPDRQTLLCTFLI